MQQVRVLVVEDEGLYRQMLTISLQSAEGVEVVGAASDGDTALAAQRELAPDVVLMDIELGRGMNGIETGRRMRVANPRLGIVLLSNHHSRQYLQAIPPQEATGWSCLLKKSVAELEVLVRAIQGSALGLMVLDPKISENLEPRTGSSLSRLTARQLEVLRLVASGHNNSAIARALYLADKSVENYLTGIYRELGIGLGAEPVHARVKAVLAYLEATRPAVPSGSEQT